jgi:hypothetical protein
VVAGRASENINERLEREEKKGEKRKAGRKGTFKR